MESENNENSNVNNNKIHSCQKIPHSGSSSTKPCPKNSLL